MAVGSPLQKNREHRKNRQDRKYKHRFNRSLCVQLVTVGVLTQYPRLRHWTGACSVGASVQPVLKRFTDQLKQAFWNKVHPMHRCFDSEASVQPVLKRSWSPPNMLSGTKDFHCTGDLISERRFNRCWREVEVHQNMLSGTKDFHCTGAYFLDHRFNRCFTWFLPSSREDRPTGHRSFRHASDAPMLGHRFNRCYWFSLFSAVLTWIRMWLWLFLLPKVVLTSIDHLLLFLSECARFLRPTQVWSSY